ncbi:MAG: hypothetical protein EBV89_12790 [Betaproteobacteria bacterium]|nr:hypothetical protein [Betaproteobacteria bacterium]
MNLPPNGSGGGLTKPELLLLPANSFFAAFTVLLALLLDLLPWGQAAAVPQARQPPPETGVPP